MKAQEAQSKHEPVKGHWVRVQWVRIRPTFGQRLAFLFGKDITFKWVVSWHGSGKDEPHIKYKIIQVAGRPWEDYYPHKYEE